MSPSRSPLPIAQLLVSVRSAREAGAALSGGAAVVDVKEPRRGPLGRADDSVLRAVLAAVAGRRPVSAALGELTEERSVSDLPSGLGFVKWGLAGTAGLDWRTAFLVRAEMLARGRTEIPRAVVVAYADAERASAPSVEEVAEFACHIAHSHPGVGGVLLLDTFDKLPASSGRPLTLLDWFSVPTVTALCQRCRSAGVRVGLAGSLGAAEIRQLLPARPDWFAVRGAACAGGERGNEIDTDRVRELARLLKEGARGERGQ